MFANFDSLQKQGQESFDAAMKAATLVSKGWQDLASETADFSRRVVRGDLGRPLKS